MHSSIDAHRIDAAVAAVNRKLFELTMPKRSAGSYILDLRQLVAVERAALARDRRIAS